ncbi:MAG: DegV family protein [Acidimicrobiia bacterium]|nr:DegV family protein [Acidimicrobiia bacterium]
MTVRIVTDSASDLTEAEAAELGVEIVPLTIRFGDEEFTDRKDLTPTEFYARLAATPVLPETAAPSPGAFETVFRTLLGGGADTIVCVNISSGLSATIQSANQAARAVDADVRVVDSRSITWGLGSQVVAAALAAQEGKGADEIVATVEGMVPRTRVYGALDTLENLKKGGRVGGAQAMLGTLLSIKPIIDISTGVVEEGGKPRTRAKALRVLTDKVAEAGEIENLSVMHGGAPDLDQFLDLLGATHPVDAIHVGEIGATIGVHGGPRVMGVTFQVPG